MKTGNTYITAALILSLMIHGAVFVFFLTSGTLPGPSKTMTTSHLVPFTVKKIEKKAPEIKPEPKPVPVPKKKTPVKVAKKPVQKPNPVPVSHKRSLTETPAKADDVKPVFGVSKKTIGTTETSAMAVRIGNTLMKEQEEAYTPPEKVRDYVTVPVFDLTTLPEFKRRITPTYPESLKDDEREGEVALSVTIDDSGNVADVKILRSSHALFAKAAVAAVKKSLFKPATVNGSAVATVLDDLVYTFVLDE